VTKQLFSLEKIIDSLDNGSFCKIICGASNTSKTQVERLALIYSLCGADVIDISSRKEIYDAARRGIHRASEIFGENPYVYPNFNIPAIMQSLNVRDDKHFRKANFNLSGCTSCLECVKTCQSGALSVNGAKLDFDAEKCYGCAVCVETCRQNAVTMIETHYSAETDKVDFDAVELHTGNSSLEEVKSFLQLNKIKEAGLVSISVDSMRFNSAELVEYVNSIVKLFDRKIIIQIDGISMRGGSKNSSTMQTIAAAAILLEVKVDAYIQLAGGTNLQTQKIVDMTGLKISGIGYGTFSKKAILSYIEGSEEKEFLANIHKIADIAADLC